MDTMLGSVGEVWKYVGASIPVSFACFFFLRTKLWFEAHLVSKRSGIKLRLIAAQQKAELKAPVESNTNVEQIAAKLQKTPGVVMVKCQRLGLQ
jgi:hypothetical protein